MQVGLVLKDSKYKWEDNIKTDLGEMGCEGEDQIQLVQDRAQ
jgi:hypothetical protein